MKVVGIKIHCRSVSHCWKTSWLNITSVVSKCWAKRKYVWNQSLQEKCVSRYHQRLFVLRRPLWQASNSKLYVKKTSRVCIVIMKNLFFFRLTRIGQHFMFVSLKTFPHLEACKWEIVWVRLFLYTFNGIFFPSHETELIPAVSALQNHDNLSQERHNNG